MQIPLNVINAATDPVSKRGRYIVDFGHETVAGFTSRQVAELLESQSFRHVQIYKVHRIDALGRREIVGVPASRFSAEDALLFCRQHREGAEADFTTLNNAAEETPPPCRARLQRIEIASPPPGHMAHLVELAFPAEFTDDMSAWLQHIGFRGGDTVEAGHAAAYVAGSMATTLDSVQLRGEEDESLAQG